MTLDEFYTSIGTDYAIVLSRLRKEDRIKKYLLQAVEDPAFSQLHDAMEAKDYHTLFLAAHTIKGMCLNLDLKPLTAASVALVDTLRENQTDKAQALYLALWEEYRLLQEKIRQL